MNKSLKTGLVSLLSVQIIVCLSSAYLHGEAATIPLSIYGWADEGSRKEIATDENGFPVEAFALVEANEPNQLVLWFRLMTGLQALPIPLLCLFFIYRITSPESKGVQTEAIAISPLISSPVPDPENSPISEQESEEVEEDGVNSPFDNQKIIELIDRVEPASDPSRSRRVDFSQDAADKLLDSLNVAPTSSSWEEDQWDDSSELTEYEISSMDSVIEESLLEGNETNNTLTLVGV